MERTGERFDHVEAEIEERYQELKKYLTDGLKKFYGDLGKIDRRLGKVEGRTC